jgi:hypothetical protein
LTVALMICSFLLGKSTINGLTLDEPL